MNKIKNNMRDVARVAASTYAFVALAIMSATTAVASLPSGYMECEYIQGNGSDAKIVTDYTPTPNSDKIEAVISFPSGALSQNQAIWCARGKETTDATWSLYVIDGGSGRKFRLDYGATRGNYLTPEPSATDVTYTVTADGNVFTWSGGDGQTHTKVADFTAGGPVMLFASYLVGNDGNIGTYGNYGKFKLYSFRVWRSGTLIHNLVPAVRESDSAKGLYDIKADKFYPGSGSFTMGDVLTSDDMLHISSSPTGIGSPSPAYGETNGLAAGASFLVSCGATSVTNAAGSVQYSCTGWKLFDDEGTLKSSGTETSFTYVHPNPAEYRWLEWQWAESPITDAITRLDETAYAQDGLVVNFDALRNAGANAPRDTSATNWVDLVSGRTATLKSLADDSILGCWTKNAYRFMGQSYFEFDEAYQIGDHYTVQVACDVWAPNSTTYNKGSFGVFGRSGGMYMQRLGTENTWDSYYFGQYGGAALHRIQFRNWDGKHLTMIRDGGNMAGTSLTTAYPAVTARGSHNGATVSGNAPAKQWMIGGWNPTAENLMNGSFHAVRIYSKAISQDEMARNMLIDRARFFGIAEAKNMVVVASGLPGAEGTEADGAYLVAGSHTFTAPQSVTVGGNTYACTGYSLETFGSNTGYYTVWGGATESPDRSYTFTETWDGTPSVRLTWQWRLIDGVERYDASLYPQHGLVANFDGIRNVGTTNAHDASAIVWRDVSGNGLHATNFVVDAALERGSWADGNGYRFVTNDQFRTSALLELGPQFTWQIATTLAADVSNAKYYRPFSSGDGKTVFMGRPYSEQSYFYCRSQAYGAWNWQGKYVNAFRNNTASGWAEGTATPAFQTLPFDQKTTGVNRWIIGGNGPTAEAFQGTVHSVRVYDRMLTAAELKNTREIDDIRFRGSVPATNTVFVATSLEGAEGDQECGIYRVAGTGHTFTATERRRIGGSGYAATRCLVETWNATTKKWENPVSSTGSTWTTPAGDSWPSRRITWYWSIPGMMIFVR